MPAKKIVKKAAPDTTQNKSNKKIAKKTIKNPLVKKSDRIVSKKVATPAQKIIAKSVESYIKSKRKTNNFELTNIVAIVIVLVLLTLVGVGLDRYNLKRKPIQNNTTTVPSISLNCTVGQTALAVLKAEASIQTQASSSGSIVTSINGNKNDNSSFWIFYVNGQISDNSPDSYNCKKGDKIEWRLEKIL